MQILADAEFKNVLRDLYRQILELGINYAFKPISEFDGKWYREGKDGPFILFPESSIMDPYFAINNCEYPNIWVTYNTDSLTVDCGLAFWSVASVDQRFVNFGSNRNTPQRNAVVRILSGLPQDWSLKIYKKKRYGHNDIVYEKPCSQVDGPEFIRIIQSVVSWREEWREEASDKGNWIAPAVNLMFGKSTPDVAEEKIRKVFDVFSQICLANSTQKIQTEKSKRKIEIEKSIQTFSERLETSKFKSEIGIKIAQLKKELEQLELD